MENQPQEEHESDGDQRDRRADEGQGGARRHYYGVVHGKVGGVAAEPEVCGGERRREIERGDGGQEFRPWTAAGEGGGEVLRRSGNDVDAGDWDCGVCCGGGGGRGGHFWNSM